MRSLATATVGAAASLVITIAAERADACGGMFCSQSSPTPIDQSAEKILFEVNDDGSVTATVEIKYNGDPQDFAWIVPVSGTPDFVEVAEKDELLLLDQATRVSITPPTTTCTNPPFQLSPCGFGCDCSAPAGQGEGELGFSEDPGGVQVTRYPSAGPFDGIVVVSGENPDVLMTYLNDNAYQVTEEMRPFIEQYTLEGYSFLATRLRADAEVNDMVPIRFHCPQPNPEIPLRLTAIAAEPDMSFLVFVVGPTRYELAPGYENVTLDVNELQASNGASNYFALVSREVDQAGGRGFVVERAQRSLVLADLVENVDLGTDTQEAARAQLASRLEGQRFITRFFTRMSAEEMTIDPVFVPSDNDEQQLGFDLSSRIYDACPSTGEPQSPPSAPPCGTLYCGEGDACATSLQGEGCVCRGDHVARATTSPTGDAQIICTSREIDVHGGDGNPCAGEDCGGAGTCLPVNDRPTCQCNEGTVAVLGNGRSIDCVAIEGDVFESEQISWPEPVPTGGCASSRRPSAHGAASIALWFIGVAVMRRVLRRRPS